MACINCGADSRQEDIGSPWYYCDWCEEMYPLENTHLLNIKNRSDIVYAIIAMRHFGNDVGKKLAQDILASTRDEYTQLLQDNSRTIERYIALGGKLKYGKIKQQKELKRKVAV